MAKETVKDIDTIIQKMMALEQRVKRLEATVISQSKIMREQNTYITHLRKEKKKTKS